VSIWELKLAPWWHYWDLLGQEIYFAADCGPRDPIVASVAGKDVTYKVCDRAALALCFSTMRCLSTTIHKNIAFGLELRRAQAQFGNGGRTFELVQLQGFGDRYPSQLSGGQATVALARTGCSPQVLLLDEPLGHWMQSS